MNLRNRQEINNYLKAVQGYDSQKQWALMMAISKMIVTGKIEFTPDVRKIMDVIVVIAKHKQEKAKRKREERQEQRERDIKDPNSFLNRRCGAPDNYVGTLFSKYRYRSDSAEGY